MATTTAAAAGVYLNRPATLDANTTAARGPGPLLSLFRSVAAASLSQLVVPGARPPPGRVLVCGLYYPATAAAATAAAAASAAAALSAGDAPPAPSGAGWADLPLRLLQYDANPSAMQAVMRAVFRLGASAVTVAGVADVVHVPLYERLDGTRGSKYVDRVELSARGGRVLAEVLAASLPEGGARPRHVRSSGVGG